MPRLILLLPLVLFLALVGYFAIGLTRDPSELPSAMIDRPVPAFDLPPVEGVGRPGLASTDLAGKPRLVNVFASWCAPCRIEHPVLTRLAAEEGVVIDAIAYKDKPQDTARFLAQLGNPFARVGKDADGRVAIDWGVYGVPETYVVDAQGHIRYRHVGPLMPHDVEEKILPMLRELSK